jgi:hypothetical protein
MTLHSNGDIGIGNTSPVSRLTINPAVIDASSFNHAGSPLTITNPTPTSSILLNDSLPVLHLCRQGTTGQAFGARATLAISRYENNASNSRTRLDIQLSHDSYNTVTAMTLRSNGNVNLPGTTASSSISTGALVVSGGIGASTGFIGTMNSNSTRTNFGFIGTDLSPYTYGGGEVGLSSRPWDKMHAAEFNVISDIRQKKDIGIYTQGLGFITQLTPKSYKYKHSVSGKIKTGFMAQEVIEVNPTFEGVNYNETDDIYTMTMDQFIAPLVNCVKELNTKIISLETELIMMKNFLRSKFPDDGI